MEKYIEGVTNCKASVAWIVTKEQIEDIVKAVKTKCPEFSHRVTMDWDDDTLLWLRFTREELLTVVPKTVATIPNATGTIQTVEKKKHIDPPRERYGGPRW